METKGAGDLVEKAGAGEEPLSSGASAEAATVIGGVQEAVKGRFGGGRRGAISPVDPQQYGFFRKRGRSGLAAESRNNVAVAVADFEQCPARGLVVRMADVVRQGVHVDADLVACLGLLGLFGCPLCFLVQAGGVVGAALEF